MKQYLKESMLTLFIGLLISVDLFGQTFKQDTVVYSNASISNPTILKLLKDSTFEYYSGGDVPYNFRGNWKISKDTLKTFETAYLFQNKYYENKTNKIVFLLKGKKLIELEIADNGIYKQPIETKDNTFRVVKKKRTRKKY